MNQEYFNGICDIIITDKYRQELKKALKKFDSEHTEIFINQLEVICQKMKERPNNIELKDLDDKLKKMKESFKKTLRFLKKIEKGERWIPFPEKIGDDYTDEGRKVVTVTLNSKETAMQARSSLEKLADMIEDVPRYKKRGQSRPKSDDTGFIKAIAWDYSLIFQEKPSLYKEGPFFKVVKITLKAMDLTGHKDPSKSIKAALKNLAEMIALPPGEK